MTIHPKIKATEKTLRESRPQVKMKPIADLLEIGGMIIETGHQITKVKTKDPIDHLISNKIPVKTTILRTTGLLKNLDQIRESTEAGHIENLILEIKVGRAIILKIKIHPKKKINLLDIVSVRSAP